MSKWISVKERLPRGRNGKDFCENIIAYTVDKTVVTGWLNKNVWYLLQNSDDFFTKYDIYDIDYVTHWMPLPEPPESEL